MRAIPWLLAAFALVLLLANLRADPVSVVVEGGLQFEPATIRLRVRVQPDAANRGLDVGLLLDGFPDPVRRSWEDLPSDKAATTRWVLYRDLEAGWYDAFAIVVRPADRNWRTTTRFQVLSRQ